MTLLAITPHFVCPALVTVLTFAISSVPMLAESSGETEGMPEPYRKYLKALGLLCIAVLVLSVVVVGGFALLRAGRRLTGRLPASSGPTDATDVWSMHKLPDETADDARNSDPDDTAP